MKKISLEHEGLVIEGTVALGRDGTLWAHVDGETFAVALEASRRGRKGVAGAAGQPGEVIAPMPGKIIKLVVEDGSEVAAAQVLVVMEAMKMEYTLKAAQAGRVAAIRCAPGDQVTLGQILMKLEPTEPK